MNMRYIDMAVFTNTHVIQAISMPEGPSRDYKLGGLGLVFEVDQRLQNSFTSDIKASALKAVIQKLFKGPLHTFDTCETGYLKIGSLPICWHITTIKKSNGKYETFRFSKQCGKHLAYKLTMYRAYDFSRVESTLIEQRGFHERRPI